MAPVNRWRADKDAMLWRRTAGRTDPIGASAPPPPPPPPPPPAGSRYAGDTGRVKFGFAASTTNTPRPSWDEAVGLLGGAQWAGDERRVFENKWVEESPNQMQTWKTHAKANNYYPVMSFKEPGTFDYAGVAAGRFDRGLNLIKDFALSDPTFKFAMSLRHEPQNDGVPTDWKAMHKYCMNFFADVSHIMAWTIICNGFWWNSGTAGRSDAYIYDYLDQESIDMAIATKSIVACDMYGTFNTPGLLTTAMPRFIDWTRARGAPMIGWGEISSRTSADYSGVKNILLANTDVIAYCNYYNSWANSVYEWRMLPQGYPAYNGTNPDTGLVDVGGTAETAARIPIYKDILTAIRAAPIPA